MIRWSARHPAWWAFWWRWVLANLVGAYVAMLLYDLLPDALTFPEAETFDVAAAPWRYMPIYGAIYGALSVPQWWVLRRYVADAWRWLAASVASAALIFPATIWVFAKIGMVVVGEYVWTAGIDLEYGIGGLVFAIVGQWLVLRRWTRFAWVWLLLLPVIGVACFFTVALTDINLELWPGSRTFNFGSLFLYCWWCYAIAGLMLAVLLGNQRHLAGRAQAMAPSPELHL